MMNQSMDFIFFENGSNVFSNIGMEQDIVTVSYSTEFVSNATITVNHSYVEPKLTVPRLRSFSNTGIQNVYIWCKYIIPFLAIFFNGLSIAVFLQRRLSKSNVSTYLIALSIFDTLAVAMWFYTACVRFGWWSLTDLGCQISVYITAVGRMCAVWLMVFFTAERFISVRFVFKREDILTSIRIKFSIIILICIMLIEQSFVWVWIEKIPPEYCFVIDRKLQRKYFLTLIGLNRVCNFFIPLILVAIMNAMIVQIVRKSSQLSGKNVSSRENNERRITLMLVLVSTINFLLLIPETTAKIMEVIESFHPPWLTSYGLVTDAISYLSHSCNFFFYVISGRQFRKDFVEMICCTMYKTKHFRESQRSSLSNELKTRNTSVASSVTETCDSSVVTIQSQVVSQNTNGSPSLEDDNQRL